MALKEGEEGEEDEHEKGPPAVSNAEKTCDE